MKFLLCTFSVERNHRLESSKTIFAIKISSKMLLFGMIMFVFFHLKDSFLYEHPTFVLIFKISTYAILKYNKESFYKYIFDERLRNFFLKKKYYGACPIHSQ